MLLQTWMVNLVEAMQSGDLDWNDRVCEVGLSLSLFMNLSSTISRFGCRRPYNTLMWEREHGSAASGALSRQ
jgi:hypothetical protein